MIKVEFINPIKNAERVVTSINGEFGDVVLNIPSIDGLATEEYVNKKVTEAAVGGDVNLDDYATKNYVQTTLEDYASEAYVQEQIKAIVFPEPDLSNYYTKKQVDDAIMVADNDVKALIPDVSGFATKEEIPDVSGYQTAEQVDAAISTALGAIGVAEEGVY